MRNKTEAGGSERVPYWPPLSDGALARRRELVAILTEDAAADAQRKNNSLLSTMQRLELSLLTSKAKAARRELQRTAPERFTRQKQRLADQLEALDKTIHNTAHGIERAELNLRGFLEQAEKAAGECGFNIGKTVSQVEAWADKFIKEAKGAAARADQRRIDLAKLKRERAALLRELAALETKMLEANPE